MSLILIVECYFLEKNVHFVYALRGWIIEWTVKRKIKRIMDWTLWEVESGPLFIWSVLSAHSTAWMRMRPYLEFNPVDEGIQRHYSIYFPFYALDLFRIRFFIFRRHFDVKKQQPKTRTNKMNHDDGGVCALGDIIFDIHPRGNAIIMIIEWPSKPLLVPMTYYDQIQSCSVT